MTAEEIVALMVKENVAFLYAISFTVGLFWSTILDFILSLISKILDKIFKDKKKKEDDKDEKK